MLHYLVNTVLLYKPKAQNKQFCMAVCVVQICILRLNKTHWKAKLRISVLEFFLDLGDCLKKLWCLTHTHTNKHKQHNKTTVKNNGRMFCMSTSQHCITNGKVSVARWHYLSPGVFAAVCGMQICLDVGGSSQSRDEITCAYVYLCVRHMCRLCRPCL